MERRRALTAYIILPCLLYGVAFAIVLTRYPDVVAARKLGSWHSVFGVTMALVLYTKKDELTDKN